MVVIILSMNRFKKMNIVQKGWKLWDFTSYDIQTKNYLQTSKMY